MLAPVDKLQVGKTYTFTYVIGNIFPVLDSTIERQVSVAYVYAQNPRVSRPLFSDRVSISFSWLGPSQSVQDVAENLRLAASPAVTLQFRDAIEGSDVSASLPCSERGPIESVTCELQKTAADAGKQVVGTVTGLVVLLVAAIVIIAFSPTGKELAKHQIRV